MLEHLVLYPSVVFVAVLGLSHSALRSVAALARVPVAWGACARARACARACVRA